jgi:putative chitinase
MAIDGRSSRREILSNPGPYEAIVVSHLDPKRMGTLQVELLKNSTSGNQPERSGQIVTVKYMSPFGGVTPISGNTATDNFQGTQKSYGMWMVPPTIGTKVLVMFAEGNIARGYWIGCVYDTYMNWMTPDPWSGSEYNNTDTSKKLPVGEYNKRTTSTAGTDPTAYIKPTNTDFTTILGRQGLIDDDIRGPANSSSRREIPSRVFGISTPGPADKRDGAPKGPIGPVEARTQAFSSVLGGSSIVMDDGDDRFIRNSYASQDAMEYTDLVANPEATTGIKTIPKGELMRFRTRTGHQILMHNSEDLIYIANAQGSTWIEMTSNGKIDIYAQDSVSVRTQNDLNVSSDRDINMTAARDINLNAGRDYKLTISNNSDVKVGVNHKLDVGSNHDVYVGATQKVFVGADNNLIVTAAHNITNQATFDVNTTGAHKETNAATLDINTTGARKDTQASWDVNSGDYNYFTSGANTEIASGGDILQTGTNIHLNGPPATGAANAASAGTAAQAAVAAPALWPVRVPVHEPWTGHEHLDPGTFTPQYTQAAPNPSPALRESTPQLGTGGDLAGSGAAAGSTVSAANVNGPQTVVPGQVGPVGNQPAMPVEVTLLQQYFLNELIKAIGLDPANALKSANPADLGEGETPGNAQALGMAMAQIQAECAFRPRSENLNYRASALRSVFPTRVRSDAFAQELVAAGPAAIANTIYGNRYGNAQDEGYKYRGRGLIQLTFKDNYRTYGRLAGHPEILENPDLVNDPEIAVAIACAYLKSKSITWTSFDFGALGQEFKKAVGYSDTGGRETGERIGLGRGFASKLITGDLTPVASITTVPAGTNTEAGNRVDTDLDAFGGEGATVIEGVGANEVPGANSNNL